MGLKTGTQAKNSLSCVRFFELLEKLMLKNTLLALTLVGCASADTVEDLKSEVAELKKNLGIENDTGSEEKTAEGEGGSEAEGEKKADEPAKITDRIAALEKKVAALEKGSAGKSGPSKEEQEKLSKLYKESQELKKAGKNKAPEQSIQKYLE